MFNFTRTQKQIILGAKIVIFALLSWFFLYQLFYSEISMAFIILTVLGIILWAITFCAGILVLDKKILFLAFILSLLSFFIFFRGSDVGPANFRVAMYYFLIMILIFITFVIFRSKVIHDKKTRLKLHFWKIFRRKGLSWVFTMICLLVAFAYYFSPSLGEFSSGVEFELPKNLIDKVLGIVGEIGKDAQDFAYEFINSQFKQSAEPLREYVPVALAVGMFFSLRIMVIFLVPLILFLTSLSMKLAISLNLVKLSIKKVDAEDIEM